MKTLKKVTNFLWTLPQPLVVLSCTGLTAAACVHQFIDPWKLISYMLWLSFPILLLLERVVPRRDDWLLDWGDLARDTVWVLSNIFLWIPLITKYYDGAMQQAFSALRSQLGVSMTMEANSVLGLIAMAFLGLFITEFIGYWIHRLQHKFLFFWRTHATHHHFSKMSVGRTERTHPVEWLLLNLGGIILLGFFGASGNVLAVIVAFKTISVHFNHCNMPLRSGIYGWFFTTAEHHQLHHSIDYAESNTNYGCAVIFWDRVFGTFRAKTEVRNIGNGTGSKLTLWATFLLPLFRKKKLQEL